MTSLGKSIYFSPPSFLIKSRYYKQRTGKSFNLADTVKQVEGSHAHMLSFLPSFFSFLFFPLPELHFVTRLHTLTNKRGNCGPRPLSYPIRHKMDAADAISSHFLCFGPACWSGCVPGGTAHNSALRPSCTSQHRSQAAAPPPREPS